MKDFLAGCGIMAALFTASVVWHLGKAVIESMTKRTYHVNVEQEKDGAK